jgi:ubiquinone/menaquinone biosynthesis C-methylase UbiE
VERFEREGREIYDKRKEIVAACRLKHGMVVADVGAGTGLFTRLLAPVVGPSGRIIAVDISKRFIDYTRKTCAEQGLKNVRGVVCTPSSVCLEPNSIDVAFISDTYHHFEYPEKTMRSIHRALRAGGQVIIVDFIRKKGISSDWVLNHVRAGQEVVTREIEAAGFRLVEEQKFMRQQYFLRFEKVDAKRKG